jgi:hypothetical protein
MGTFGRARLSVSGMRAASFLFVCLAGGLAFLAIAGPARAGTSASDCVSIQSAQLSTGLAFDVQNACEKRLSCALTWTLTCENASGKTTSKAKQEAKFIVDAADTHHMTGSSAACKDGWKIDDVAWDCAPAAK